MTDGEPDVLEKLVPPWMSRWIMERGYYHVGGAVVRAVDMAALRTPAKIVEAWSLRYEGSPFGAVTDIIEVLRFPMHPLMSLTKPGDRGQRPWPTYANGFLRADAVVPVWTLERTRLPAGTELWRIGREGEQHLLAAYSGPARGWTGGGGYWPPVDFVGTRAKWNDLDTPAEIVAGGESVEIVVVAEAGPPGFEQVRPGVWLRIVPRAEVEELFELTLTCRYRDVPCRIIQRTDDRARLLLMTDDPDHARRLGAEMIDPGVFEVTARSGDLADLGGTTRDLKRAEAPPPDPAQIISTIVGSLLEEPKLISDPDWDTFAVISSVRPGVADMSLYRYAGPGPGRATPLVAAPLKLCRDLQTATAAPDGTVWELCILKVDRDTGRGSVAFVYANEAEPWKITPESHRRIVENLRPQPADFT